MSGHDPRRAGLPPASGPPEAMPPTAGDSRLTEHVAVRFPEQMATAASRLAQQDGMSTSAWVRKIVAAELAARPGDAPGLLSLPWRVGRRKGRNIYAVAGGDPDDDPEVGKMDTPELAAEACAGHNALLEDSTA